MYRARDNEPTEVMRSRLVYQSRKRGMLENGLLLRCALIIVYIAFKISRVCYTIDYIRPMDAKLRRALIDL